MKKIVFLGLFTFSRLFAECGSSWNEASQIVRFMIVDLRFEMSAAQCNLSLEGL